MITKSDRVEVAEHLCTAEGVDRLFGIADQQQRRKSVKCPSENLPLQRIRVLELVHENHPEACADTGACGIAASRIDEHSVQQCQQIVEVSDAPRLLSCAHLGARFRGENDPVSSLGVLVGFGDESRLPIAHRFTRELTCVGRRNRRRLFRSAVAPQVDIVDDLVREVVDRLDESGFGLAFACDAETREHALTEAVCGRDRSRVEFRERANQT